MFNRSSNHAGCMRVVILGMWGECRELESGYIISGPFFVWGGVDITLRGVHASNPIYPSSGVYVCITTFYTLNGYRDLLKYLTCIWGCMVSLSSYPTAT